MGERMSFIVIKGCTQQELEDSIEACVTAAGGYVLWNSDEEIGQFLGIRSIRDVHTCFCEQAEAFETLFRVADMRHCLLLNARIQEGDHWDYTLSRGEEVLDEFTTNPSYWLEEADRPHFRGKPELVASLWDVPIDRVDKYLVDWGIGEQHFCEDVMVIHVDAITGQTEIHKGTTVHDWLLKGKAYPDDQFGYGNIWQVYDFIRALGGDEPPTWRLGDMLGKQPAAGSRHNLVFSNASAGRCDRPQRGLLSNLLTRVTDWFRWTRCPARRFRTRTPLI